MTAPDNWLNGQLSDVALFSGRTASEAGTRYRIRPSKRIRVEPKPPSKRPPNCPPDALLLRARCIPHPRTPAARRCRNRRLMQQLVSVPITGAGTLGQRGSAIPAVVAHCDPLRNAALARELIDAARVSPSRIVGMQRCCRTRRLQRLPAASLPPPVPLLPPPPLPPAPPVAPVPLLSSDSLLQLTASPIVTSARAKPNVCRSIVSSSATRDCTVSDSSSSTAGRLP